MKKIIKPSKFVFAVAIFLIIFLTLGVVLEYYEGGIELTLYIILIIISIFHALHYINSQIVIEENQLIYRNAFRKEVIISYNEIVGVRRVIFNFFINTNNRSIGISNYSRNDTRELEVFLREKIKK